MENLRSTSSRAQRPALLGSHEIDRPGPHAANFFHRIRVIALLGMRLFPRDCPPICLSDISVRHTQKSMTLQDVRRVKSMQSSPAAGEREVWRGAERA